MSIDNATPEEWYEVQQKLYNNKLGDMVNHPAHYKTGGIECIEAIQAFLNDDQFKGYLLGNAFKYLWRCQYKGKSKEDLNKCKWYIDKYIEVEKK